MPDSTEAASRRIPTGPAARADAVPGWISVLLALIVFGLIQVMLASAGLPAVADGRLWDPDAYMWLNRARHLWETGAWFDPLFPRLNPPNGFVQHWTRPLDALLVAGLWALEPVLGVEQALFLWGALIGPVLMVPTLVALAWAAKPLLPPEGRWLLPLVFVAQPGIASHFAVGRPDHHALIDLFALFMLGFAIRMLLDPIRRRHAIGAGLMAALILWVSVQALPAVMVLIAVPALCWLTGRRPFAQASLAVSLALWLGLAAALLVEGGRARLTGTELDTLSGAHLFLASVNAGFWTVVAGLQAGSRLFESWPARVAAALIGVAAAAAAVRYAVPQALAGARAIADPLYLSIYHERIRELQPLIPFIDGKAPSWNDLPGRPLASLGVALPALPCLVYLVRRSREGVRWAWTYIGLISAIYGGLTFAQIRWAGFAELALVLPYALFAGLVLRGLSNRLRDGVLLRLTRPLLAAVLCLWIYAPGTLADANEDGTPVRSGCRVQRVAADLADPEGLGRTPLRLVAFADHGPELLYRTPHSIFAIPSHRHQPGFTATYRALTATDMDRARAALDTMGADLILICPDSVERNIFGAKGGQPSLFDALASGRPPPFVRALDADPRSGFRLFAFQPKD